MDIDPIIDGLRFANGILTSAAKYTATKVDDQIAEVIAVILVNQALIDLVKKLAGDDDAEQAIRAMAAAPTPPTGVQLGAISWVTVLQYLPVVIEMVRVFLKKK